MATYYFNPHSKESNHSQWLNYKQQSSHIKDVVNSNNAVKNVLYDQLQSVQQIIQVSNEEQVAAIQNSTNAVCGTLEKGFSLIDSQLDYMNLNLSGIKSELSNIASILDWNFSILIAEQKISNMLMGNIAQLLKIPDIQKERQYAVEQGLKFLRNSLFDEDFFEDALKYLLKAESIEPTDYFILHHIGLIYLNSIKNLDIIKAETYFKKAAKYAFAETLNNAAITHDILKLDTNQFFENQTSIESIKLQAAESYMYIGRCRYIQGDMQQAAEYANKAYSMVSDLLDAGYLAAKAQAALGKMNEAFQILDVIVDKNRFYITKILSDKDFIGKNETSEFLIKKRNETIDKAKQMIDYCKKIINPHSNAQQLLTNVIELTKLNNFLAAKEAIDILGL